jgi:hypothetical protein
MATELVKPTRTATKPAVKAARLRSLKNCIGGFWQGLGWGSGFCFGGAPFAEGCWPGVARHATHFFCFAKKSKQKKGDPQSGSLRFAAGNLRCSSQAGSRANSPAAQTSAIPDPLVSALLGPARTGQSGAGTEDRNIKKTNTNKDTPWRVLVVFCIRDSVFGCWVFLSPPLVDAPRSAGSGGSGIALFEPKASLARPRLNRAPQVARSAAEGRSNQGRLFFCLLFFWRSKRKVSSRRATPGQQPSAEGGGRKTGARQSWII